MSGTTKSAIIKRAVIQWGSPRPKPHGSRLAVEFDARGARALVRAFHPFGYAEGVLGVWDLERGKRVDGEWLALHPDGERALVQNGKSVDFVNIASGKRTATFADGLGAVSISPEGRYAVGLLRRNSDAKGSMKRAFLRVYDLETGKIAHELKGSFLLECFVPNARLATVDASGTLQLWDLATGRALAKAKGPKKPMAIRRDRAGSRVLVSCADGSYSVWDASTLDVLHSGRVGYIATGDASFDDGRHVVSTNVLFDVSTKRVAGYEKGWLRGARSDNPREATVALEFPHAAVLVQRTVLGAPSVEIWDVEHGVMHSTIDVDDRIHALAGLPGGRLLVVHAADTDDPATAPALTVLDVPSGLFADATRPDAAVDAPRNTKSRAKGKRVVAKVTATKPKPRAKTKARG
jgi:WD40 repeat protein